MPSVATLHWTNSSRLRPVSMPDSSSWPSSIRPRLSRRRRPYARGPAQARRSEGWARRRGLPKSKPDPIFHGRPLADQFISLWSGILKPEVPTVTASVKIYSWFRERFLHQILQTPLQPAPPYFAVNLAHPRAFISCRTGWYQANSGCLAR